jgi:hypothetical protein
VAAVAIPKPPASLISKNKDRGQLLVRSLARQPVILRSEAPRRGSSDAGRSSFRLLGHKCSQQKSALELQHGQLTERWDVGAAALGVIPRGGGNFALNCHAPYTNHALCDFAFRDQGRGAPTATRPILLGDRLWLSNLLSVATVLCDETRSQQRCPENYVKARGTLAQA